MVNTLTLQRFSWAKLSPYPYNRNEEKDNTVIAKLPIKKSKEKLYWTMQKMSYSNLKKRSKPILKVAQI